MKKFTKIFVTMIVGLLAVTTVLSGCTTSSYFISNDKKYKTYSIRVNYQESEDMKESEVECDTENGVAALYDYLSAGTYDIIVEGSNGGKYEECATGQWKSDDDKECALVISYDADKGELNFKKEPCINEYKIEILQDDKTVGEAEFGYDSNSVTNINAVVNNLDAGSYTYNICFKDQNISGTFDKTNGKDYNLNVVYNKDTQKALTTEVKA